MVADVVVDLHANGEPVPEPLAAKKYSGRFMVRVPLNYTGNWRLKRQNPVST